MKTVGVRSGNSFFEVKYCHGMQENVLNSKWLFVIGKHG